MEAKLKNNKGIAMITVLLITVILGILTVVALHELGYDVINAGQNTNTEYARNISNSATSIILPVIGAGGTLGGGITINPMDSIIIGDYYYTTANSNTLNNNTTYVNLNASNLLSTSVSQSILGNTQSGEQIGFEYEVTTCWGYTINPAPPYTILYYYYTGFINVISRDNANSKLVETGANFTYGTFTTQPANCAPTTTTNPA